MHVLRTPDARFEDLPDWPWEPRYVDVPAASGARLRVHLVDEGARAGPVVLLLHGDLTWGYLWRRALPALLDAGLRVVVPDLVGFGRSDKPGSPDDHDATWHVRWLRAVVAQLDLHRVTLVAHGWGGVVGLRLMAEVPPRFEGVVLTNTALRTGEPLPEPLRRWRALAARAPDLDVGGAVREGCVGPVPDAVVAAYEAPFVDEAYKAGPRALPGLVPDAPDAPAAVENRRAWTVLRTLRQPVLTAFSDRDPVTAGWERTFREALPGARRDDHVTLHGAGHFTPEERGEELGRRVAGFVAGRVVS